jgi:hypothetical protein
MMSADVEGSFAGFFAAEVPLGVGGGGVLEALPLPLVAASACALFFFRAISISVNMQRLCSRLDVCGYRQKNVVLGVSALETEPSALSPTLLPSP